MHKTLIHISDLHFGRIKHNVADTLLDDIAHHTPHLVIVSGDLTQRARTQQFQQAAAFLKKISYPKLIIPGNHDVCFLNPLERFTNPLKKFKHHISDNLHPSFRDQHMAVIGINSTNPKRWRKGRLSRNIIETIQSKLSQMDKSLFKVLVLHHNLLPSPNKKKKAEMISAAAFAKAIDVSPPDLILAGHLHQTYWGDLKKFYGTKNAIIVAQAGTATSDRYREEKNAYNVVTLNDQSMTIKQRTFADNRFNDGLKNRFIKKGGQWVLDSHP